MALITEDFNTYTIGTNLNTLNNGSGWSAAWTSGGVPIGAPINGKINKIAQISTSSDNCARTFNTLDAYKLKLDAYIIKNASTSMIYFGLTAGGNEYKFVFNNDTFFDYRYNGLTSTGNPNPFPSLNKWYKVTIIIDTIINVNNVIFYVDDVATATFSTTITSLSGAVFQVLASGFASGLSFTDLKIEVTSPTMYIKPKMNDILIRPRPFSPGFAR